MHVKTSLWYCQTNFGTTGICIHPTILVRFNKYTIFLTKYSPSFLTCFGLKCCLVLLLLVSLLDQLDATYWMHSSFQKPTTPEKICSNVAAANKNPLVIYYCCSTKWLHFCLFRCTLPLSTALSSGALVQWSTLPPFCRVAPWQTLHQQGSPAPRVGAGSRALLRWRPPPLPACLQLRHSQPLPTRAAARKSRLGVSTIFGQIECSWKTTVSHKSLLLVKLKMCLQKLKSSIKPWYRFKLP